MADERFTPFFFPEFGWVLIVVALAAVLAEIGGSPERSVRRHLNAQAPFRVHLCLRLGFDISVVGMGWGLLTMSRLITYTALIVAAMSLIPMVIIQKRYTRKDSDESI